MSLLQGGRGELHQRREEAIGPWRKKLECCGYKSRDPGSDQKLEETRTRARARKGSLLEPPAATH